MEIPSRRLFSVLAEKSDATTCGPGAAFKHKDKDCTHNTHTHSHICRYCVCVFMCLAFETQAYVCKCAIDAITKYLHNLGLDTPEVRGRRRISPGNAHTHICAHACLCDRHCTCTCTSTYTQVAFIQVHTQHTHIRNAAHLCRILAVQALPRATHVARLNALCNTVHVVC